MKKISLLVILCPFISSAEITNQSSLSIVQTGGNSHVETYNFQTSTEFKRGKRTYTLSGHYTLGRSESDEADNDDVVESARNWDAKFKYEQELSKKLSGILAIQYEGDVFSGYKQRENTDIGAKYSFVKTDKLERFVEFGFRHTNEKKVVRNDDGEDTFQYTKGRIYFQTTRKVNSTTSYQFWVEYLPNFTEPEDYQVNFEPSLALILDETFSLKLAYKGQYDNEPNIEGNEYLDYTYTTSLLAKF